jgi:cell wall-associated NlpC family hydrolase
MQMRRPSSIHTLLWRLAVLAAFGAALVGCASLRESGAPAPSASEPLPLAEDGSIDIQPLAPEPEAPGEVSTINPLIERALSALGTRYRYGGNTLETGFDCSGFVRWVFHDIATQLPRSAHALSEVEAPLIERDALQPADVLFFRINRARTISHVGIYMGNGQFIHSPSSGGRVRVESIDSPYWRARLVKARRWTL